MLESLVESIDILLQKQYAITGIAVSMAMLIVLALSPILHGHSASWAAHINAMSTNQAPASPYNPNPNEVTDAMATMGDDAGQVSHTVAVKTLRGALAVTGAATTFDTVLWHGMYNAGAFSVHLVGSGVLAVGHAGVAVGHVIGDGLTSTGHAAERTVGFFSGITHVSAVIRPTDHTPTPTITQMREQQAAIIQSGTKGVTFTAMSSGFGGACDNGEGNGGYPLGWCNAPMDTIATVSYSGDPINRECTSYAYWYFTAIEGQTSFRAWGNAKYWATSSNYPTYDTPTVGAIAVETAGAYGHVAIVQALPGQKYAGQVVPAGYVLVSEMNYDWAGHFRYSYSPLTKFSAYIYPKY